MRAAKKAKNERMHRVAEKSSSLLRELAETRSRYGDAIDREHADFLENTIEGLRAIRQTVQQEGGIHGRGI